jgi:hypothetical protein
MSVANNQNSVAAFSQFHSVRLCLVPGRQLIDSSHLLLPPRSRHVSACDKLHRNRLSYSVSDESRATMSECECGQLGREEDCRLSKVTTTYSKLSWPEDNQTAMASSDDSIFPDETVPDEPSGLRSPSYRRSGEVGLPTRSRGPHKLRLPNLEFVDLGRITCTGSQAKAAFLSSQTGRAAAWGLARTPGSSIRAWQLAGRAGKEGWGDTETGILAPTAAGICRHLQAPK